MTSITQPGDQGQPAFDAEELVGILVLSVAEHPLVASVRRAPSVYIDRISVIVEDVSLWEHRLHVLTDVRRSSR